MDEEEINFPMQINVHWISLDKIYTYVCTHMLIKTKGVLSWNILFNISGDELTELALRSKNNKNKNKNAEDRG